MFMSTGDVEPFRSPLKLPLLAFVSLLSLRLQVVCSIRGTGIPSTTPPYIAVLNCGLGGAQWCLLFMLPPTPIFTRPGMGMAVVWFGAFVILCRRFIFVEAEQWGM